MTNELINGPRKACKSVEMMTEKKHDAAVRRLLLETRAQQIDNVLRAPRLNGQRVERNALVTQERDGRAHTTLIGNGERGKLA